MFIRGLHNLRAEHRGSVLTIGSFDGLHLGHRAIIEQVKERAGYYGLPSVVMMFEPQPREFFSGEQAPARLMRMREKVDALGKAEIDRVFCVGFNRQLSELSAQEFVDNLLVQGLDIKCLVIGDDFHFGCDRKGDFVMLAEQGQRYGFEVVETYTVSIDGQRVSSTRIRHALEVGDFLEAERLLGQPFCITGRVVYGQQLGGQLGIPTANVNLHRYRAPLRGVFAVEVLLADGQRVQGVANVGVRPTVGDLIKPVLEVHMLDWSGDIYGQRIAVEFKRKLREEQKFTSLDDLVESIQKDIGVAREYFGRSV
ncbi:MAG: bifunctional riboflavin kinase/FMN adenylyltransferase [Gammaproteobacteria bacterium]|nr:MAG: bifunctional riboflavin kinase/FMN adenylyltransferase [Gammaproteobacteria bacterium]RLA53469.1 MAG: bifunctional riboflavin kinase/FMN adenylyltransferase [Gammaproteobacteria bacterium]